MQASIGDTLWYQSFYATTTTTGSITGQRPFADWVTSSSACYPRDYGSLYAPKGEPEKPPKYDPFKARQMWHRDALPETRLPRKRPSQQVVFNQVSRLRPVRPRYLSRKR